MKYVHKLKQETINKLNELYANSTNKRERERAHCILLSHSRFKIKTISQILNHHRVTISIWIDNFEKNGLDSFLDSPHTGRPPILTETEIQAICNEVPKYSRELKKLLPWIKNKYDKVISFDTLKRIVKKKVYMETNA